MPIICGEEYECITNAPSTVSIMAIVAFIGSTISAACLASDYAPGFLGDRSEAWIPGTIPGSAAGNPAEDKNGNPVWFYAYTAGGYLGATNLGAATFPNGLGR